MSRLAGRLSGLEKRLEGSDVHAVYARCLRCGGLHVRNLAQIVAAGDSRTCECAGCGCESSEQQWQRILEEYRHGEHR